MSRYFSFGGGIQSTAALILAARREIDFKTFIFANTGNDSENPATLEYFNRIHKPYAEKHGIEMVEVQKKNGQTLYENCMASNRTISIPVYLPSGAPGTRKCTVDWKIKPVAAFSRKQGATKHDKATMAIGISMDEVHRASDSRIAHQEHEHPLLDLKLNRRDCANIIREEGLPMPPKSSCWFCPYKKLGEWQEMATHDPELFEKAAKLEAKLEAKRGTLGKDSVYLTRRLVPLREAVLPSEQLKIFGEDEECTGYCWT